MRLPRELAWTLALAIPITVGYVLVASSGPPAASGLIGHTLGVIGFLAMAAGTAGYAWRKRRNGPGSMQRWLEAHVVSGLIGPYLVLLHTGFAFRGLAGAAFLLLAVVVASGLTGRLVYTRIPKPPPRYVERNRAYASRITAGRTPAASHAAFSGVVAAAANHTVAIHDELREKAQVAMRRRRALSLWWLLHVPLAIAMFALAMVHVLAALYYATLLR